MTDISSFVAKKEKDIWQTPHWLIKILNEKTGGIDLDPCAGVDYSFAGTNISIENGDNGLEENWGDYAGVVYINPPFSNKTEFIKKCCIEKDNVDMIILLTPDSTDVKSWYHNLITNNFKYTWFSKGRIDYHDPIEGEIRNGVPFGTALHFTSMNEELKEWLESNGDLVKKRDK